MMTTMMMIFEGGHVDIDHELGREKKSEFKGHINLTFWVRELAFFFIFV